MSSFTKSSNNININILIVVSDTHDTDKTNITGGVKLNLPVNCSSLLVRQYDAVGELIRALEKTYVINAKTKLDVAEMWVGLSQIRALLPVQMSQEEEELMRKRLW